jgi:agmatinase
MKFPSFFADAEESFVNADYVIVGVPYEDANPSFREGAHFAPDAIREASWNFETYNLFNEMDLQDLKVHDFGNIDDLGRLRKLAERIIKNKKKIIVLGGSHSITPFVVKPLSKCYPNLGVLVTDAHLDYRNTYQGTLTNHACTIRRISEIVPINQITLVGIRSGCKKEKIQSEADGLSYYTCSDVARLNIKNILKQLDFDYVYLSIDMDAVDPSHAPGVSTPEPFGLDAIDVFKIIREIAPRIIGIDVVEVCPSYDTGITALLAAKFIREYITWNSKH